MDGRTPDRGFVLTAMASVITPSLEIVSHVATLPCEIFMPLFTDSGKRSGFVRAPVHADCTVEQETVLGNPAALYGSLLPASDARIV